MLGGEGGITTGWSAATSSIARVSLVCDHDAMAHNRSDASHDILGDGGVAARRGCNDDPGGKIWHIMPSHHFQLLLIVAVIGGGGELKTKTYLAVRG